MPTPNEDDRKRLDPFDPRTGATGNDEPTEIDDDEDVEGDEEVEGDGEDLGG